MTHEAGHINEMASPSTAGDLIASGETVRQIQTSYVTAVAVQKPRDLKDVVRRCIEEAELAGDLFYYRWPTSSKDQATGKTKKSFIEGPSINLALAAVRNFGNMAVQQRPVQETRSSWIFTAAVIDLETGFTLERQFRMSKDFTVYGKMDAFRKEDLRFQVGQSKAIRNAVTNAVPAGLIDKMITAAKNSVRAGIESKIAKAGGIVKVVDGILEAFEKFEISQKMIEDKIGLKRDKWDAEILTLLAGDLKALISGNETVDSLYAEDEPEQEDKANGAAGSGLGSVKMKPGDPAEHQDVKDGKVGMDEPVFQEPEPVDPEQEPVAGVEQELI